MGMESQSLCSLQESEVEGPSVWVLQEMKSDLKRGRAVPGKTAFQAGETLLGGGGINTML